MAEDSTETFYKEVVEKILIPVEVQNADQAATGIGKVISKIDKLEGALSVSNKALNIFTSGLSGVGIAVGSLSLGSIVNGFNGFNKALITGSSQFSKYNIGISSLDKSIQATSRSLSVTREETLELFKAYERGFPLQSLSGANNLLLNIKNTVGANVQEIGRLQAVLGQISSTYPELQKSVENLSSADKLRINNSAQLLLIQKKISLEQFKQLSDYTNQNNQVSQSDKDILKKKQEQVAALEESKRLFEEISIKAGQTLLPMIVKIVDAFSENKLFIRDIASGLATWGPYIATAIVGLKTISSSLALIKGVSSGVGALFSPSTIDKSIAGAGGAGASLSGGGQSPFGGIGTSDGSSSKPFHVVVENMEGSELFGNNEVDSSGKRTKTKRGRASGLSRSERIKNIGSRKRTRFSSKGGSRFFSKNRGTSFMKSGMGKLAGKASVGGILGGLALGAGSDYFSRKAEGPGGTRGDKTAAGALGIGSGVAGVAGMAATGAALGSFVPVIGNIAGAVIGGIAGVAMNFETLKKGAKDLSESLTKEDIWSGVKRGLLATATLGTSEIENIYKAAQGIDWEGYWKGALRGLGINAGYSKKELAAFGKEAGKYLGEEFKSISLQSRVNKFKEYSSALTSGVSIEGLKNAPIDNRKTVEESSKRLEDNQARLRQTEALVNAKMIAKFGSKDASGAEQEKYKESLGNAFGVKKYQAAVNDASRELAKATAKDMEYAANMDILNKVIDARSELMSSLNQKATSSSALAVLTNSSAGISSAKNTFAQQREEIKKQIDAEKVKINASSSINVRDDKRKEDLLKDIFNSSGPGKDARIEDYANAQKESIKQQFAEKKTTGTKEEREAASQQEGEAISAVDKIKDELKQYKSIDEFKKKNKDYDISRMVTDAGRIQSEAKIFELSKQQYEILKAENSMYQQIAQFQQGLTDALDAQLQTSIKISSLTGDTSGVGRDAVANQEQVNNQLKAQYASLKESEELKRKITEGDIDALREVFEEKAKAEMASEAKGKGETLDFNNVETKAKLEEKINSSLKDNNATTNAIVEAETRRRNEANKISELILKQKEIMFAQVNAAKAIAEQYAGASTSATGLLNSEIDRQSFTGQINQIKLEELRGKAIDLNNMKYQEKVKILEAAEAIDSRSLNEGSKAALRSAIEQSEEIKGISDAKLKEEAIQKQINVLSKDGVLSSEAQKMIDLEKNKIIAETQGEINGLIKEQYEINSKNVQVFNGQLEAASAVSSLLKTQVDLYDSIGVGVGASVKMRMEAVGAVRNELDILRQQISAQEEVVKNATGDQKMQAEKELNQMVDKRMQKEKEALELTKQMREGWLSAINAKIVGSGRIMKIAATEDQNLSALMVKGGVRSNKSGANQRAGEGPVGSRESQQFQIGADGGLDVKNKYGGVGYTDDVSKMYGLPNSQQMNMAAFGKQRDGLIQEYNSKKTAASLGNYKGETDAASASIGGLNLAGKELRNRQQNRNSPNNSTPENTTPKSSGSSTTPDNKNSGATTGAVFNFPINLNAGGIEELAEKAGQMVKKQIMDNVQSVINNSSK